MLARSSKLVAPSRTSTISSGPDRYMWFTREFSAFWRRRVRFRMRLSFAFVAATWPFSFA